jgi:hypothetical protein
MTKPGLRHPLTQDTQKMITDCLDIVVSRQVAIEKETGTHTKIEYLASMGGVIPVWSWCLLRQK